MAISHTPVDNVAGGLEHQARLHARRLALTEAIAAALPHAGPFVWEVGCGHGHFLTAYAAKHADTVCVGIDIASDRIERALRKRDRAKLANLHFLQAEATFFLTSLPSDRHIRDTFVLFPDPWPKSRHHKHRVLQPAFLTRLATHCLPGAGLFFRTDFRPYLDHASSVLHRHAAWRVQEEPWPFEYETVFQSRAAEHGSLIARRVADGS